MLAEMADEDDDLVEDSSENNDGIIDDSDLIAVSKIHSQLRAEENEYRISSNLVRHENNCLETPAL